VLKARAEDKPRATSDERRATKKAQADEKDDG